MGKINWSMSDTQKMHTVMSQFVLDAYGNALTGYNIDENGDPTGSKFYSANVMDSLRAAVEPVGDDDPNPYAIAYAYGGDEEVAGEFLAIDNKFDDIYPTPPAIVLSGSAPTIGTVTVGGSDEDAALLLEHTDEVNRTFDREMVQYMAGAFARNEHYSSTYGVNLALLLGMKARQIGAFSAKLKADRAGRQAMVDIELERLKAMASLQWANMNLEAQRGSAVAKAQYFSQYADYMLKHWTAQSDRYAQDAAYNVSAVRWKLDTSLLVAQMLSPIGNVPLGPPQPTRLQQGLSMALSAGSNIGMSIGSQFGPGAGIAAGILGAGLSFGAALL